MLIIVQKENYSTFLTKPQLSALLKKSDHLTQNDKMQQCEGVTFSFDTYNSTKGELLDFLNKAQECGFVDKVASVGKSRLFVEKVGWFFDSLYKTQECGF